eukprot:360627-Chlamydomonas_euryale.AAC.10
MYHQGGIGRPCVCNRVAGGLPRLGRMSSWSAVPSMHSQQFASLPACSVKDAQSAVGLSAGLWCQACIVGSQHSVVPPLENR